MEEKNIKLKRKLLHLHKNSRSEIYINYIKNNGYKLYYETIERLWNAIPSGNNKYYFQTAFDRCTEGYCIAIMEENEIVEILGFVFLISLNGFLEKIIDIMAAINDEIYEELLKNVIKYSKNSGLFMLSSHIQAVESELKLYEKYGFKKEYEMRDKCTRNIITHYRMVKFDLN